MDIFPQLVANSIVSGAIYAVLVLGFNLIFSTAKFIDIGYGVMVVVGGYAGFYFMKMLGLSLWVGVPLAVLLSGVLSLAVYKVVYAPLRARKASSSVLLIASLGVLTFIQAIVAILFTSQFQTLANLLPGNPTLELLGGTMTAIQLATLIIAGILTLALFLLLRFSMFGKALVAVSDDEEVAKMVGINTEKNIGSVFFVAGCIGGLAGLLIGFDTGIEPTMGLLWLLSVISASIVGGIGNLYGGIAGAFLVAFIENFGIWKVSGEWRLAIAFTVLLIFLVWKPKGLFPR